jgi:hypothetical protein
MRPTEHGLRFTPKMAQGMAGLFAREIGQQPLAREMADRIERRAWDLNLRYEAEGTGAVEYFLEFMLKQEVEGNLPGANRAFAWSFSPESAREFSRRVRPALRIFDEFWKGLLEDARPLVNDRDYEEMKRHVDEALELTQRFDEKMDRWSRGEIREREGVLDGIDEDLREGSRSREYVVAERNTRWQLVELGPEAWRRYLGQAGRLMEFDGAQKARGEALLSQYEARAKQSLPPGWQARASDNRVRRELLAGCRGEPLGPWTWHLDREFRGLTAPVREMGRAFRREVLAIARPEQRAGLLKQFQAVADRLGVQPEELQAGLLPLVSSTSGPADGPAASRPDPS